LQKWLLEFLFFTGETEIDVLESIFKKIGTPSFNTWPGLEGHSFYTTFPLWKPLPLETQFSNLEPAGLNILNRLLQLDPMSRITARIALRQVYFDKVSVEQTHHKFLTLGRK